ncbi:MAG: SRPBCC family protein [bacterium]|nr:SRPBCC family protein [bacterium]
MKVKNVHERKMPYPASSIGALIDTLASESDKLWPNEKWPPMKFDQGLQIGARGGHGPIRYTIQSYEPGRSVHFRFTGPKGFDGYHAFVVAEGADWVVLRHIVEMKARGAAAISWPLVFGPLHDALIEDGFDKAERNSGGNPSARSWSWWVRALRWALGRVNRTARRSAAA